MDDFTRGARAMFDILRTMAANNYHHNPEEQARRDIENDYLLEATEDALDLVSPESCSKWRDICALRKDLADTQANLEAAERVTALLYDGYTVFKEAERTDPSLQAHNVSHVLDAVVRLAKALTQEDKGQ